MWHIPFNPVGYIDFGGVITDAVEVWSWKLCQIKYPLVFDAPIRGSVNQIIALLIKTKPRGDERDDYAVRCFD